MTNGRDDRSREWREGRDSRWTSEAERGSRDRHPRDDERGFFDRAGDEIASWFGDDEAERRRAMDDRGYRGGERSRQDRPQYASRDRDDDRYARSRMDEDRPRRPYSGRPPERDGGGYRPMAGDYGRAGREAPREQARGFGGAAPTAMPAHDRHYSEWRQRQIDEIDRDYDEYRREHQSKFESEFSTWRQGRQSKRQMLGQVREHMEVVGSDDQPLGKIDHVRRDRIILAKSDSDDGRHHAVNCAMFDRVEGDKLYLSVPAEEAKARLYNEEASGRALFERDDQGSDGPHILDRSFSGTY